MFELFTQILMSVLFAAFPPCEVEDQTMCLWQDNDTVVVNTVDLDTSHGPLSITFTANH